MTTASIFSGPSREHLTSGVLAGSWLPNLSWTEIQKAEEKPASARRIPTPELLHLEGSHSPGTTWAGRWDGALFGQGVWMTGVVATVGCARVWRVYLNMSTRKMPCVTQACMTRLAVLTSTCD